MVLKHYHIFPNNNQNYIVYKLPVGNEQSQSLVVIPHNSMFVCNSKMEPVLRSYSDHISHSTGQIQKFTIIDININVLFMQYTLGTIHILRHHIFGIFGPPSPPMSA